MPQITFRDWRLTATSEDADTLRLDIEALDGSDILEMSFTGESAGCEGEPYVLRLSTEKIEATQKARGGQSVEPDAGVEADDEGNPAWSDDEETIYTRGWEITTLVDEEGVLGLEVERQDEAEIYALEPLESGVPLASHVSVRLAAEEDIEDEDDEGKEDAREEEGDEFEDLDELEETDDLDELEDDVDDEMENLYGEDWG